MITKWEIVCALVLILGPITLSILTCLIEDKLDERRKKKTETKGKIFRFEFDLNREGR
jgi:hypothetical protein